MKKIMLLMATALVALSACSKSTSEPVVQKQEQKNGEMETISLSIEGERDDIPVVDEEGRVINLTGNGSDGKLTSVTLGDSQEVDGIIYLYKETPRRNGTEKISHAQRVKFTVEGKKISYQGSFAVDSYIKGNLPYLSMDIYVGGKLSDGDFDAKGASKTGVINYEYPNLALRTEGKMDLSAFNPIYYSLRQNVVKGESSQGQDKDYYSNQHRFRLYGEFVSCRFRMKSSAALSAVYNGVYVRGFGTSGLKIVPPYYSLPNPALAQLPQMVVKAETSKSETGKFLTFSDQATYRLKSDNKAPQTISAGTNTNSEGAYTLYLFATAERYGGIRIGHSRNRGLFEGRKQYYNFPNYWGNDETYPTPYQRQTSAMGGKFHNILVVLDNPKPIK